MFCSILFTICVEIFLVRSKDLISCNNVDITVEYESNATDTLTIDVTSDSALLDLVTDGNVNTGIPLDSRGPTLFSFKFNQKWKVCYFISMIYFFFFDKNRLSLYYPFGI